MAVSSPSIPPHVSVFLFIIICIVANPWPRTTAADSFKNRLRNDTYAITEASIDYGNIIREKPSAVLYPSSVNDIIDLIKFSYNRPGLPFTIAVSGNHHSVWGQSMSHGGVVVSMAALSKTNNTRIQIGGNSSSGFYADVGGEQLWIEVLRATLMQGLAPISWTDYLHLSVAGTLSNAGVSGQTFLHGPQITKVLELDVITGKGEFITCSPKTNSELFFAVLGGLGQFGIIMRVRIVLDIAPTMAKRVKLLYSNFVSFTSDQEHLISSNAPNYVEGLGITNEDGLSEWNSSSRSDHKDIVALLNEQGILYYIELVKYYDNQTAATIDQDIETLVNRLNFIPGYISNKDVTLFDFLTRVPYLKYSKTTSHPWLVLLIPRSSIYDFNDKVFSIVFPKFNETSALVILYPIKREKWDNRMSAVIPNDEDVFYELGLLHHSRSNEYQFIDKLNDEILTRCKTAGIRIKQYLPHYRNKTDWKEHYGTKWEAIRKWKAMFDPKMILAPGQRIFN